MGTTGLTGVIGRQEWLEPVENTLQRTLNTAFESSGTPGRKIKNALHGTWLGHPLHVVLTDVPIGAWTAAMMFDVMSLATGRRDFCTAADSALTFGIAGALGAAAAGLTDWKDTDPPARRVGLVHGLLNVGGVALFTASLIARRRRSRALGQALFGIGYAVAAVSARLGGNLVYGHRIGVDHTAGQKFPENFVPVLAESDLAEGAMRRVEHNGVPLLVAKQGGRVFALAETCSHLGGPLAEGQLLDGGVKCPWHGSCFSLEDGRVLDGPAVHPAPWLRTRVRNGQIEVGMISPASQKPQENPAPAGRI